MKKHLLSVGTLLLAGSLLFTSCIGSFGLFNKYEKWQCNMTSSKFVNGIVGLILQPIVGTVCLTVDALVLNTIEFWSGKSPVTASTMQNVQGRDGRMYAVQTTRKGYKITSEDGDVTLLTHNAKENAWYITQNGETRKLISFNGDGTIDAILQSGEVVSVEPNASGLLQVQQAVAAESYYALN